MARSPPQKHMRSSCVCILLVNLALDRFSLDSVQAEFVLVLCVQEHTTTTTIVIEFFYSSKSALISVAASLHAHHLPPLSISQLDLCSLPNSSARLFLCQTHKPIQVDTISSHSVLLLVFMSSIWFTSFLMPLRIQL